MKKGFRFSKKQREISIMCSCCYKKVEESERKIYKGDIFCALCFSVEFEN